MQPWEERPVEVANLFNPAFCGVILTNAVLGYSETNGQGMPFGLAFLVLPIVLHEETRKSLPRGTRTSLLAWIEKRQERLIGFADRVRATRSITREAVMFALAHRLLQVDERGDLIKGDVPVTRKRTELRRLSIDTRECLNRGTLVGRWFAEAGTASTIMASLGIAP